MSSANWLEPGAWVANNSTPRGRRVGSVVEKIWATNSEGRDFRGADLSCVVCQCVDEDVVAQASCPQDLIMILLVTREDIQRKGPDCFKLLEHVEAAGHKATSGPHIKYINLLVPVENVLRAPGTGAPIVLHSEWWRPRHRE